MKEISVYNTNNEEIMCIRRKNGFILIEAPPAHIIGFVKELLVLNIKQIEIKVLFIRFGFRYEVFDDEKRTIAIISSVKFCCGLPGGSGFKVSFS
jgi:hypothetical protein